MIRLAGRARDFARALRAVAPFASVDVTRATMHKVHLSIAADGVPSIYATDGHTLARWRGAACESYAAVDVWILPDDAERVYKAFARVEGVLTLDTVTRTFAAGGVAIQVAAAGTASPPYERVIPGEHACGKLARIGASPRYIVRAFEAFGVAMRGMKDKEGAPIVPWAQISFTGDALDPMRVTSPQVPELLVIVMPVRL